MKAKRRRLFRTVYIDSPWPEKGGGKIKRGADRHYPVMPIPDIYKTIWDQIYGQHRMAWDAHMYMWATNNFLPSAFNIMNDLGFRYITMVTWVKGSVEAKMPYDMAYVKFQLGLGQYFRGCSEHCLFGVRGRIPYRMLASGKRAQGQTAFIAPRTDHSRKPELMRKMIEDVSPPPYLELFARERHSGWTVWGNEV